MGNLMLEGHCLGSIDTHLSRTQKFKLLHLKTHLTENFPKFLPAEGYLVI